MGVVTTQAGNQKNNNIQPRTIATRSRGGEPTTGAEKQKTNTAKNAAML